MATAKKSKRAPVGQESLDRLRQVIDDARREADLRGCATAAEMCKKALALIDEQLGEPESLKGKG